MYESISVVGERGQITIPKTIRELEGLKAKDRVIVRVEGNKIVVEKALVRKDKEKLMKEYYIKYAGLHKKINKEWEVVDREANRFLDEY